MSNPWLYRALCIDGDIHLGYPLEGQPDILCVTDWQQNIKGKYLQIEENHRPQRFAGIYDMDGRRVFEGDEVLFGKLKAMICFDKKNLDFYLDYGNMEEIVDESHDGRVRILRQII